ncbi:uncharacterized protein [Narcine bancroftii]|uniref:uncharacterized protein n=1 Tax=Narcine bancroftii TaxID=1343680 RepID=UPI003831A98D
MGGHLKAFFGPVGILALTLFKVNIAFVGSVNNISDVLKVFNTTEQGNVTNGPELLGTTEEEYFTEDPELLGTTEEEYFTEDPELLGTTEEEYFTEDPKRLGTTEEEYFTEDPERLGTTEEEYINKGPELLGTTEEEYVTNNSEFLGNQDNVLNDPEVLGNTQKPYATHFQEPRKHKSYNYPYILLIIIGILIILCTILLVSTIALAYQLSTLKAKLKKRSARSNSDFIKTASLWSNGFAQVAGEAGETNVTLEEVKPLKEEDEAKLAKSTEGAGGKN